MAGLLYLAARSHGVYRQERECVVVRAVEPDLIFDTHTDRRGGSARRSGSHEVMEKHTSFEYEEWRTLKVGLRCRLGIGAPGGEVQQVIPMAARKDGRRSGAAG